MTTPVTPNVGFSLPTPDQYNQSPSWGQLINRNFQLADQFLPTSDNPLTPDRFLISADLDFRQFNAINLSSAQFTPLPSAAAALDSIYFYAGEFWITDNAGNQVQITSNGTVNSATGNISGLPSSPAGAGIAWNNSAGAFEFLGAGGTVRPTLKTGPVALYDTASGPPAFAVMLKSPSALAASYSATFPAAPPATTLPVSMNNSGVLTAAQITAAQIAAHAITQTQVIAPVPVAASFASGFSGTAVYWRDVGGVVHLQGTVISNHHPVVNGVAFNLPSGFLPTSTMFLPAYTGTGATTTVIEIDAAGSVRLNDLGGTSNPTFTLGSITFLAAP